MPSHYRIDATRTDLARAFRQRPLGPHSPDLQHIVNRMRWSPLAGRHVLVTRVPYREWVLGTLTGRRGEPPVIDDSQVFHTLEEAEWAVFKLRWQAITGEALVLDGEGS